MKTNYWIEFLTLFINNKVFFNFLLFIISFYTSYSQQTEKVDFINVKATVQPIFTEKKVKATASYTFKILKKCDSIYLDAANIYLLNTKNFNSQIKIVSKTKKIWLFADFK